MAVQQAIDRTLPSRQEFALVFDRTPLNPVNMAFNEADWFRLFDSFGRQNEAKAKQRNEMGRTNPKKVQRHPPKVAR
jgi:hypothetical protein